MLSPSEAPEGRFAEVAAALLVGGASRRMGEDKARRSLLGLPAATGLARMLEPLFQELLLVGGDPPPEAPGRRVSDGPGPRCALRGLVAALAAARSPRVLVLATDLVTLTPTLPLALLARPEAGAVVPRDTEGRAHPLCALYRREPTLAAARRAFGAGRLALRGLLEDLEVQWLEGADLEAVDPLGAALHNANTPEEWSAAEARLRASRP